MSTSTQHLAAILPSRGASLVIQERPTPVPGPHELLIEVKAIALNPIDYMQRKRGLPPIKYPAILGSDIAGTVVAVGSAVSADAPQPGCRVAAYAPSFFVKGAADYGAFQTRVLVPAENAAPLPDRISFNEGSVMPMAVQTAWSGLLDLGLSREAAYTPEDKKGILVWGAGSSVGSAALQIAEGMGLTVYATASKKHHDYLQTLGASRVFEYQDPNVVANIIKAGQEDGVTIDKTYLASGALTPCIKVMAALKGSGAAQVALAPFKPAMIWWKIFPNWNNTAVRFVTPPAGEEARRDFFHFVFRVWLKDALEANRFVPSPKVKVVSGGLAGTQKALEELEAGVSGTKLVVEV